MAEGLLRHIGRDEYEVFSAGTHPKNIHPRTIEVMEELGIDLTGQTSKDMREFLDHKFDYVITVCDRAAETCPVFPGAPERLHWSFEDPAAVAGTDDEKQRAFDATAMQLLSRIRLWVSS